MTPEMIQFEKTLREIESQIVPAIEGLKLLCTQELNKLEVFVINKTDLTSHANTSIGAIEQSLSDLISNLQVDLAKLKAIDK